MTTHSSARPTQQTSRPTKNPETAISNSLKRHARSLIKDESIDSRGIALIRYALATSDPWLPELVRRAIAGEPLVNVRGLLGKPRPLKAN